MTKREFNTQTQVNFGGRMASDERESYREERMLPYKRGGLYGEAMRDRLAERAAYRARVCERRGVDAPLYGALVVGSRLRAPYRYRYGKVS